MSIYSTYFHFPINCGSNRFDCEQIEKQTCFKNENWNVSVHRIPIYVSKWKSGISNGTKQEEKIPLRVLFIQDNGVTENTKSRKR